MPKATKPRVYKPKAPKGAAPARKPQYKPRVYKSQSYSNPLAIHAKFDAFHDAENKQLAVPGSIGAFLPIAGVTRTGHNTSTSGNTFLIYQWTNSDMYLNLVDTAGILTQKLTTQLTTSAPTAVRPMKATLELKNTSIFTAQTGVIRVLSCPLQFAWSFVSPSAYQLSTTALASINLLMNTHPDVKTYSATDMAQGGSFVIPPASNIQFSSWGDYFAATGVANAQAALTAYSDPNSVIPLVAPFGAPAPVQNVLIIEFVQTSATNNYDITLKTQTAARFDLTSLYSNLVIKPIPGNHDQFNRDVAYLQKTASSMIPTPKLQAAHAAPRGHSKYPKSMY